MDDWFAGTQSAVNYILDYSKSKSSCFWNKEDAKLRELHDLVHGLLARDDPGLQVVANEEGRLCSTYPIYMFVPSRGLDPPISAELLETIRTGCRFARVRMRFPVPVILYRGAYLCRSSTLAYRLEAAVHLTASGIPSSSEVSRPIEAISKFWNAYRDAWKPPPGSLEGVANPPASLIETHRHCDLLLLRSLGVGVVVDLMVETNRKQVGVMLYTSEKAGDASELYERHVEINALPYPGIEVFHNAAAFHGGDMAAWGRSDLDFWKHVPENEPSTAQPHRLAWPDVPRNPWPELAHHRQLNLNALSHHHLRAILDLYARQGSTQRGLLLHCISGWDRTPMFVSLVRLSLWADGALHPSLGADEMLFLTVIYDWLLFRHQLSFRIGRHERIMDYAFHGLMEIAADDCSVNPDGLSARRERLARVRDLYANLTFAAATDADQDSRPNGIFEWCLNKVGGRQNERDAAVLTGPEVAGSQG